MGYQSCAVHRRKADTERTKKTEPATTKYPRPGESHLFNDWLIFCGVCLSFGGGHLGNTRVLVTFFPFYFNIRVKVLF